MEQQTSNTRCSVPDAFDDNNINPEVKIFLKEFLEKENSLVFLCLSRYSKLKHIIVQYFLICIWI